MQFMFHKHHICRKSKDITSVLENTWSGSEYRMQVQMGAHLTIDIHFGIITH